MIKIFRTFLFALGTVVLLLVVSPTLAANPTTPERLRALGGVPCPDSRFTCVTLTVPLDHFTPSDTRTLDVVFAILPAAGTRKGMFVTATGGPGTTGIAYADSYTEAFHPDIPNKFDIVFFDQRGIGLSGGLDCYQDAARFYAADWSARTPRLEKQLRSASKEFATDCDARMGYPEILPYLGTKQAVEDLELFRRSIGDDKFWLYGESYGTQYAQTYANAHGDHLAGMILDGTVDLSLDGITYYTDAAQSFDNTLRGMTAQCHRAAKCQKDFVKRPLVVYDQLAAVLRAQKQTIAFPLGNGTRVPRSFEAGDLETIAVGQLYGQSDRMMMMRALAAYARDGDLVPLARLLYPNMGVDETTLEPIYDPAWSDAIYYGVECQDYGYFAGTPEERADQYVAQAKAIELTGLRFPSLLWGDLPCVYWRDSSQNTTRPPHGDAAGVPTLVLNALADPITSINSARAVYEHLDDGYLITQRGGPHVIFGRGVACIDSLVTAFLVDDQVPAQRETECGGKVMTKYVPLAPRDAAAFKTLVAAFVSAETEINYLPEYWYWDFAGPARAGCPVSGWLKFRPLNNGVEFTLDHCAFSNGFVMTGGGTYHFGRDRMTLNVDVTGYQTCTLHFERTAMDAQVQGVCDGIPVNEQSELPVPELLKEFKPPLYGKWMQLPTRPGARK